MDEDEDRAWMEERAGDTWVVRARIGREPFHADFEVLEADDDVTNDDGEDDRTRVAHGSVRHDGCANATLVRDDGTAQHWCSRSGVEAFGHA